MLGPYLEEGTRCNKRAMGGGRVVISRYGEGGARDLATRYPPTKQQAVFFCVGPELQTRKLRHSWVRMLSRSHLVGIRYACFMLFAAVAKV